MIASVAPETPDQPEVAALLRLSDEIAAALYPGAFRRPLNPQTLAAPGIHLLVARVQGAALGCCAVFEAPDGTAELKRMVVHPDARGQGLGQALLQAAEGLARGLGCTAMRLEVGIRNEAGAALYTRAGYRERGPFGGYAASPISRFMERALLPDR